MRPLSVRPHLMKNFEECIIWTNVSSNNKMTLKNLVIALCYAEQIGCDKELLTEIIRQLEKGIDKFELEEQSQNEPQFIFFTKKEHYTYNQEGTVEMGRDQITRVSRMLAPLRQNKLTVPKIMTQPSQQLQTLAPFLSKKSQELAYVKRSKIVRDIRQRQPQVGTIELHHILSYQQKQNPRPNSPVQPKVKEKKVVQNNKKQSFKYKNDCDYLKKKKREEKKKRKGPTMTRKKTKENIEQSLGDMVSSFDPQGQQMEQILHSTKRQTQQIIDELEWQEIPKQPEDIRLEEQLYSLNENDLKMEAPAEEFQQELKRKQYLELPILYVDVNIEEGKKERIVIYDGDKADQLAAEFGQKHGLQSEMIERLEGMLAQQIGTVLAKIDETAEEDCSELY